MYNLETLVTLGQSRMYNPETLITLGQSRMYNLETLVTLGQYLCSVLRYKAYVYSDNMSTTVHFLFFGSIRAARLLSFQCCVFSFSFVCRHPVCCVPNVTSVSRLYILDWPNVTSVSRLYILDWPNVTSVSRLYILDWPKKKKHNTENLKDEQHEYYQKTGSEPWYSYCPNTHKLYILIHCININIAFILENKVYATLVLF
jgi:hypothetical protein